MTDLNLIASRFMIVQLALTYLHRMDIHFLFRDLKYNKQTNSDFYSQLLMEAATFMIYLIIPVIVSIRAL